MPAHSRPSRPGTPRRLQGLRSPGAGGYKRTVRRYEIARELDPRAVEALLLDIRLLARRYKVTLKDFRVEPEEGARSSIP